MRIRTVVAAALLTVSLAGCGHTPDEAAWQADLADIGVDPAHWGDYVTVWVDEICPNDQEQLEMFVAIGMDEGQDPDMVRTNIRHACPDRLPDLEEAFDSVNDAGREVDVACALPESERTQDQADLAEAMGC